MVGFDSSTQNLSQLEHVFAGGASGFITRAICQPLDVLKIRFQLQIEPIKRSQTSKYHSVFHAATLITTEEGVKALWKGHIPAQFLSISYGVAQFWGFEELTRHAAKLHLAPGFTPVVNFTCGSISAAFGAILSFPFDVVRTRLVAQSEQSKLYKGLLQGLVTMVKTEGPLSLYKGLWATVIQVIPHGGVQFMTYKVSDGFYRNITDNTTTTLTNSFISGSIAGLVAKTVVYPFDLAKKRIQIQGFEKGRAKTFGEFFKCSGLNDCLIRIYQVEGFIGLFKGLSPSLLKAVVTTALHFSCYEMICKMIIKHKAKVE